MNGFSVEWLGLREPLDVRSRSAKLAATLAEAVRRTESRDLPIQVVDLGAGTGANLRYLAPLLGGSQDWLLADRDPSLLDALDDRMRIWADSSGARVVEGDGQLIVRAAQFKCRIRCVAVDLATELDRVVLPERCLVTASGLLDLVSEDWLARLAHRSMNARASVWFTLSYDGRINCNPAEPEDRNVRELFNRHQLGDKGFGPALGPGAARRAAEIFEDCGYRTRSEASDWRVQRAHQGLQRALLDDWFDAATEIDPDRASELRKWRERRLAHIESGRSELIVGHADMIGWPKQSSRQGSQPVWAFDPRSA